MYFNKDKIIFSSNGANRSYRDGRRNNSFIIRPIYNKARL